MTARIRKNDTVVVLSGRDKDRQGSVIEVLPKKGKVLVKGIGMVTRHVKAGKQGETGGIKKQEGYLLISRVMPICTACKKACRIVSKVLEDGQKARACNRCKEII